MRTIVRHRFDLAPDDNIYLSPEAVRRKEADMAMQTVFLNNPVGSNATYVGNPPDDNFIITDNGGNDTVTLGNGIDQLTLSNGNNTLTLGNGPDQIVAGAGNNTVTTG